MRNTFVGRLIRRSSWSRWYWGAGLLLVALALIAYTEHTSKTPSSARFRSRTRTWPRSRRPGARADYYLTVQPDQVARTGFSRTRNAATEANYLLLQVADRLLFSDVAVEHEGRSFTGFLEAIPIDEKNGVLEEILSRSPQLRDRMLPFKLNCWYGFKANGYVLAVLLGILTLGGLWLLGRATIILADPERHPIARKLRRFGEPEQVAAAIDAELEAGPVVEVDGTRMTPSWLIPKFGSVAARPTGDTDAIFKIEDLVWVHQQVMYQGKSEAGAQPPGPRPPRGLSGDPDPGWAGGPPPRRLAVPHPWIITTYTPQLASLWRLNRAQFVQEVDQRRAGFAVGEPPAAGEP